MPPAVTQKSKVQPGGFSGDLSSRSQDVQMFPFGFSSLPHVDRHAEEAPQHLNQVEQYQRPYNTNCSREARRMGKDAKDRVR
jgi:hypothetical protein